MSLKYLKKHYFSLKLRIEVNKNSLTERTILFLLTLLQNGVLQKELPLREYDPHSRFTLINDQIFLGTKSPSDF